MKKYVLPLAIIAGLGYYFSPELTAIIIESINWEGLLDYVGFGEN